VAQNIIRRWRVGRVDGSSPPPLQPPVSVTRHPPPSLGGTLRAPFNHQPSSASDWQSANYCHTNIHFNLTILILLCLLLHTYTSNFHFHSSENMFSVFSTFFTICIHYYCMSTHLTSTPPLPHSLLFSML